ncbi:tRNA (adenosine(37)-N6)-threonylcarbamoyltransferase complex ATPase subunit type 1 TsaE [Salmonirosea aquatica]|uniref:tRNA threonylcarbamoyladenosine biosynthesis protein TsaE n=1 Tax=Salmonirosea aquatica TaxID=2654236 RepID=A0A7C9F4T9_9BACT|nr:tRNA (adenosine(37)-N6)-threonylcarbamoyltransferase complex ATPase subunit type 1 TsaE [Cytophagaceae bacterium SJW1-29]
MNVQPLFIRCSDLTQLDAVAQQLLQLGGSVPVWLLHGDMGAGKTTLIKQLCERLGVRGTVQSPTFSIVNEYDAGKNGLIYHFDFYRIKNESEAYDLGADEYLDSGAYCFIEWPEKIESLWPETYFSVTIQSERDGSRSIRAMIEAGSLTGMNDVN